MSDTESTHTETVASTITSRPISSFVHLIFFWCLGGISLIYGIRLYHDIPIHPSFLPIIGAAFAAVLSFTLVMALRMIEGPIDIEVGKFHLKGAGGPIVLWCVCFITVAFGLFLLGVGDVAKSAPTTTYSSCSAGSALLKECSIQNEKRFKP